MAINKQSAMQEVCFTIRPVPNGYPWVWTVVNKSLPTEPQVNLMVHRKH